MNNSLVWFGHRILALLLLLLFQQSAIALQNESAPDQTFDKLVLRTESSYIYGSHTITVDGATGRYEFETKYLDGLYRSRLTPVQLKLLSRVLKESNFLEDPGSERKLVTDVDQYDFELRRNGEKILLKRNSEELTPELKKVVNYFERLITQQEHFRDLASDRGWWPGSLLHLNMELDQALQRRELEKYTVLPLGFERLRSRLEQLATSDDPRLVSRSSRALRAIKSLPAAYVGDPIKINKQPPQGDSMAKFNSLSMTFYEPIKDVVKMEADGWCNLNDSWIKISENELLKLDELCRQTDYFRDKKAIYEVVAGDWCEMAVIIDSRFERMKLRGPNQSEPYQAFIGYCVELIRKYRKRVNTPIQWEPFSEETFARSVKENQAVLVYLFENYRSNVYHNFEAAINSPSIADALRKNNVLCLKGDISSENGPIARKVSKFKTFQQDYYSGPGIALYLPGAKKMVPIETGKSVRIKETLIRVMGRLDE